MKKIFIGLSAICILMFGFAGCDSDYVKYSGPDYIMFSDTLSVLPVQTIKLVHNLHRIHALTPSVKLD